MTMSPGSSVALFDRGRDRHGHGAQVHRHVVAHGDDLACGIEDGAGVVAALFDVGREGGAAQGGAHLLGNGVVEVLEDFEFDGIAHERDECTPKRGQLWGYNGCLPTGGEVVRIRRFSMRSVRSVSCGCSSALG